MGISWVLLAIGALLWAAAELLAGYVLAAVGFAALPIVIALGGRRWPAPLAKAAVGVSTIVLILLLVLHLASVIQHDGLAF
jgi:hypothetical protein